MRTRCPHPRLGMVALRIDRRRRIVLRRWFGDQLPVTRYTGYVMPWLLLGLMPGVAWACEPAVAARSDPGCLGDDDCRHPRAAFPIAPAHRAVADRHAQDNELQHLVDERERDEDGERGAATSARRPPPPGRSDRTSSLASPTPSASSTTVLPSTSSMTRVLQAIVSRHPSSRGRASCRKGTRRRQCFVPRPVPSPSSTFIRCETAGGATGTPNRCAPGEDVLQETGPVILGGDFNAPDRSQLYGMVSSVLHNAHGERGFGFGFTYPAVIRSPFGPAPAVPLVRIDHIFFTDHFVAVRAGPSTTPGARPPSGLRGAPRSEPSPLSRKSPPPTLDRRPSRAGGASVRSRPRGSAPRAAKAGDPTSLSAVRGRVLRRGGPASPYPRRGDPPDEGCRSGSGVPTVRSRAGTDAPTLYTAPGARMTTELAAPIDDPRLAISARRAP